jgi:hypothetical protein
MQRVKQIMDKSQFVSFGGNLRYDNGLMAWFLFLMLATFMNLKDNIFSCY